MDIEELKQAWQRTQLRLDTLDADNRRIAHQLAAGRATTAQQWLVRYYRRSFVFSLFLPVLSIVLYEVGYPAWMAAIYALFGFVMAAVNISFSRYIAAVDYMSLPMVTALSEAIKIRRRQQTIRTCSFAGALGVCMSIFFCMMDMGNSYVLEGGAIGLVVGVVVGILKHRRVNSYVRAMESELRSMLK